MVATEALKEDHRLIERMLNILENIANRLEKGEEVSSELLKKASDFISTFADTYHHGKEENILFPTMEERGFPREGGPIAVMLVEHDEGRGYARNLFTGIEKFTGGDKEAARTIIDNARNYAGLLSQHIQKEDNILYMMADNIIPGEVQQQLLGRFDIVEKEKLGEKGREYYINIVEELEKELS